LIQLRFEKRLHILDVWRLLGKVPRSRGSGTGIHSAEIIERFERGMQIPSINQLLALATLYGADPQAIDLGGFDRVGKTATGDLYLLHASPGGPNGEYVALLEGWILDPSSDSDVGARFQAVQRRSLTRCFVAFTPREAMAQLDLDLAPMMAPLPLDNLPCTSEAATRSLDDSRSGIGSVRFRGVGVSALASA
jgi:hypothetical protein